MKWVCIHGHFYQPPRENPWTGLVERQASATPFRDWNQRITVECYRANAAAPVQTADGKLLEIIDNYEHISWNAGPTLLAWLSRHEPSTYQALLDADRRSLARYNGHGAAMAQAYGHLIMPLASARDKVTQVRWGIADFEHRFGRRPAGMWLPECAVDVATLEVLAAEGIAFTILAPRQAARFRPLGSETWQTGEVATHRVYVQRLPSGRTIDLFFYDGALSQAVAFERLLADGARLAERLAGQGEGLRHIATDGETYGHHHRFGEMALAWAIKQLEALPGVQLTNYAAYRAQAPATWEVEVVEGSSWSCAHGVLRWREDCGCNSGGRPGWSQAWRRPLRAALDWLATQVNEVFTQIGSMLFADAWGARDAYVHLLLANEAAGRVAGPLRFEWAEVRAFLGQHAAFALSELEAARALAILEAGHYAQAMYTSCGWFFDDLAGLETVQILRYAARALDAINFVGGEDLTQPFLDRLALASSNVIEEGNGRTIWLRHVATSRPKVKALRPAEEMGDEMRRFATELDGIYERARPLLPDVVSSLGELPSDARVVAQVVLRRRVVAELRRHPIDLTRLVTLVEEAREVGAALASEAVQGAAAQAMTLMLTTCAETLERGELCAAQLTQTATTCAALLTFLPGTDIFYPRRAAFALVRDFRPSLELRFRRGELDAQGSVQALASIAHVFQIA